MVGAWASTASRFIPFSLLQGQGRPDLTAKIHAAEVVPFLIVLWLLMTHFGLVGAAIAAALRTGSDCLILLRVSGQWSRAIRPAGLAAAFMAACCAVAMTVPLAFMTAALLAATAGLIAVGLGLTVDPVLRQAALSALPPRMRAA